MNGKKLVNVIIKTHRHQKPVFLLSWHSSRVTARCFILTRHFVSNFCYDATVRLEQPASLPHSLTLADFVRSRVGMVGSIQRRSPSRRIIGQFTIDFSSKTHPYIMYIYRLVFNGRSMVMWLGICPYIHI